MLTNNFDSIMKTFQTTVTKLQKRVEVLNVKNKTITTRIDDLDAERKTNNTEIGKCVNAVDKLSSLFE